MREREREKERKKKKMKRNKRVKGLICDTTPGGRWFRGEDWRIGEGICLSVQWRHGPGNSSLTAMTERKKEGDKYESGIAGVESSLLIG